MAITWGNPDKNGKFIKNYRIIGKHMANPRTQWRFRVWKYDLYMVDFPAMFDRR